MNEERLFNEFVNMVNLLRFSSTQLKFSNYLTDVNLESCAGNYFASLFGTSRNYVKSKQYMSGLIKNKYNERKNTEKDSNYVICEFLFL